jgi:hypothetical protein
MVGLVKYKLTKIHCLNCTSIQNLEIYVNAEIIIHSNQSLIIKAKCTSKMTKAIIFCNNESGESVKWQ